MTEQPYKPKRGKKSEFYVQPVRFDELIEEYYENGVLSEELCQCVLKIANKLSFSPNFARYSYREEMVGDAIEKMISALTNKVYKYNPNVATKNGKKGNAFMYFSKISYHAMVNRIKIETKNAHAIDNYREEMYDRIMGEEEGGSKVKKQVCNDEENHWG
jgi:hypothetical protein